MGTISKTEAIKLIKASNGRFGSVTFINKQNEERKMNFKTGVKKGDGKGKMKYNPSEMGYITVFDMQEKDYRLINAQTIKEVTFNKQTFKVK